MKFFPLVTKIKQNFDICNCLRNITKSIFILLTVRHHSAQLFKEKNPTFLDIYWMKMGCINDKLMMVFSTDSWTTGSPVTNLQRFRYKNKLARIS